MLVYGKNVVNEIIKNKIKINKVFLSNDFNDEEILIKINNLNLKKFHMDKNKLDKMCNNTYTQGIALDIEEYSYLDFDKIKDDNNANFIVMLDSIEDPHNFGAIIRTCECAGVNYIIIPKKRSVSVTSSVYKTSAGALANVNIVEVVNLANTISKLKELGYWVYGAEANGKNYRDFKYDGKVCLVIGSEGKGLKQIVVSSCDEIISIPMKGKVNSLNASVSAGILIYEMQKYK